MWKTHFISVTLFLCIFFHPPLYKTKQTLYFHRTAYIFQEKSNLNDTFCQFTWLLLAATDAYSITRKSIEHAVPEYAGMITIEKHHCLPILPCLHIVSYPFFLIASGLSGALYPMPRPFYKQTIDKQKKQSGKCS